MCGCDSNTRWRFWSLCVSTVFAGKEPNQALGMSSLKPEDCEVVDYEQLSDEHRKVLDDWYTFFSKRYNIVGRVKRDEAAASL